MRSPTFIREGLKSFVQGSSLAQNIYSRLVTVRAARHRAKGRVYSALQEVCTAHSRLGQPKLEKYHLRQIVNLFRQACYRNGQFQPHEENHFYQEFTRSDEARSIRLSFQLESPEDRARLRRHREDGDPGRQGNLMVLKMPNVTTGEKGVLMVTYNSVLTQLASLFQLGAVLQHYRVVFEPSYSRNFEPGLFLLCGADSNVVLSSRCYADHEFIHRAQLGFDSVYLGASDWVDPDVSVYTPHLPFPT